MKEILILSAFWQTIEKVGSGFLYHADNVLGALEFRRCLAGQGDLYQDLLSPSLSARLIPAYGLGVVRLPVQPNRCTFVQSRAKNLFE